MVKVSDYINEKTTATFVELRDGDLWYRLSESELEFPVPLDDTKGATFKATDKGIFFMRWVRKFLEDQPEAVAAQEKMRAQEAE